MTRPPAGPARCSAGGVETSYVVHGEGTAVLVLHGGGVDHREPQACFEPVLGESGRYRRVYPDLPGMGLTPAPSWMRSADQVLDGLLAFADEVVGAGPALLVGHSAGAYYARAMAAARPDRFAGLALVCPLLPGGGDVPPHRPVVASPDLGDEEFRSYFVVQTPRMLARYERFVAPGVALADGAAAARIGQRWRLTAGDGPADERPTVVVAGRQDSVVGYAAAVALAGRYPHATLAVVDGAGHALPHEQPEVMAALLRDWLARVEDGARQEPAT